MTPYFSPNGSGVTAFEIGEDFIKVRFDNFNIYHYPASLNGIAVINHMKALAISQSGLNSFINQRKPKFN